MKGDTRKRKRDDEEKEKEKEKEKEMEKENEKEKEKENEKEKEKEEEKEKQRETSNVGAVEAIVLTPAELKVLDNSLLVARLIAEPYDPDGIAFLPFRCPLTQKPKRLQLIESLKHQLDTAFACPQPDCGQAFPSAKGFVQHVRNSHRTLKDRLLATPNILMPRFRCRLLPCRGGPEDGYSSESSGLKMTFPALQQATSRHTASICPSFAALTAAPMPAPLAKSWTSITTSSTRRSAASPATSSPSGAESAATCPRSRSTPLRRICLPFTATRTRRRCRAASSSTASTARAGFTARARKPIRRARSRRATWIACKWAAWPRMTRLRSSPTRPRESERPSVLASEEEEEENEKEETICSLHDP